jgi:hypothetical protein
LQLREVQHTDIPVHQNRKNSGKNRMHSRDLDTL